MEALLRFVCLLACLLAVHGQCPPSWVKVENSCYRAFGQSLTYDAAAQACRQFVGCDGVSPGHLACPTSFEERRVVRKLRFDILQPLRGNQIGEGQRLRPRTIWLGFRLGQGTNSSWESTEMYDNAALDQFWGPNRAQAPGFRPQNPGWGTPNRGGPRFDPTNFRWNGRCMTLPGQMQMNGAIQKWGHMECRGQAAYVCEISAPGIVNSSSFGTGGFNDTQSFGPPGQPGWNNPGGRPGAGGGQWPGQGGGRGGQWPGQGGGRGGQWPGQGAGQGGQWPGQGGGRGGQWPGQGAGQGGQWPNQPGGRGNPGAGGAGGWNPRQPGAGGAGGWNPRQPGAGGAGGWNPRQPGAGGAGGWNPNAGAGGAGGWNPNQGGGGGRWPNQGPRLYQQAATP